MYRDGTDRLDDQVYSSKFLIRNQIIAVVEELVKTKNYSDVTVKEICEHVSISRQTFYRHFESKTHMSCWVVANIIYRHFNRLGPGYGWDQALADIRTECSTSQTTIINMAAREVPFEKVFDLQRRSINDLLIGLLHSRNIPITTVLGLEVELYSVIMSSTFLTTAYEDRWHGISSEDCGTLFAQVVPTELKAALLNS